MWGDGWGEAVNGISVLGEAVSGGAVLGEAVSGGAILDNCTLTTPIKGWPNVDSQG